MGGKVTVVGAGFYGSTTALRLAEYNIFDTVVLTDILEGKPEGLALDIINRVQSKDLKQRLLVQQQLLKVLAMKLQLIQM
jgi:malate/lactate dehydrogenase